MSTIFAHNRSVGVTCGELIDTVAESLYKHVSKDEMEAASNSRAIISAYWLTTVPRTPLTYPEDVSVEGVRRIDWLLYNTALPGGIGLRTMMLQGHNVEGKCCHAHLS